MGVGVIGMYVMGPGDGPDPPRTERTQILEIG